MAAGASYLAVWRPGSGAQRWVTGASDDDFRTKDKGYFDQGLRLFDIEIHGGKFSGVWRPGSGAQWWFFGNDYEMVLGRDKSYFDGGPRLLKVFPYPGSCDNSCLNQAVMPAGSYNYGITRTAQHCPGLPGTCGTPAAGDVVDYRWPCLTFDGSQRFARMPALTYSDAGANSFPVHAAAPGRVIFIGWDWWSGNTIVISHDSGGVKDAFRTIYMHLRNEPTHDADQAWNVTAPKLQEPGLSQSKNYLTSTGCPKGGPYHPKPEFWGTDADQIDMTLLGKQVAAGAVIAHSGCTGPGGRGCTKDQANWTWGGGVNTHLHIFFARRDPSDNEWYFIDPYGIYSSGGCYPALDTPVTTPCARYPVAWKGGKAQYL